MAKRHTRGTPEAPARFITTPNRVVRLAPLSVTEKERDTIRAAAKERGMSVSAFLRQRALA